MTKKKKMVSKYKNENPSHYIASEGYPASKTLCLNKHSHVYSMEYPSLRF